MREGERPREVIVNQKEWRKRSIKKERIGDRIPEERRKIEGEGGGKVMWWELRKEESICGGEVKEE